MFTENKHKLTNYFNINFNTSRKLLVEATSCQYQVIYIFLNVFFIVFFITFKLSDLIHFYRTNMTI